MVRRKRVSIRLIHGEHADDAVQTFQRHDQSGLQRRMLSLIDNVSGLNLRIAIDDRLAVFSHPSAQSFADSNLQR